MAHPCCICHSECYCSGDIDDVIVSKTPKSCNGCDSCIEEINLAHEDDEEFEEEFDEDDALNDIAG